MRLDLTLSFSGKLKLPYNYNNLIQALIYSHIQDESKRIQLHDYGYMVGSKKIKLMTFSKLFGKYELDKDFISFTSPIQLFFSSYDDSLTSEIAYNLMADQNMYLNGVKISVVSLKPIFFDENKYKHINYYMIEMLSPVTVYHTEKNHKKIFYDPWDPLFSQNIAKNIFTKLKATQNEEANDQQFFIRPNNIKNTRDEKIVYFKDTLIKAYYGIFTVKTTYKIMKLLYYSGLGSKNSEGFGSFRILGDGT
jgi:CRISPR-associated endoribonuclease Cas6